MGISDDGFENFFKPLEYRFYMGDKNLIISADCRTGEVETAETESDLNPSGKKYTDPFDELDDDFGDDDLDF